MFPPPNNIVSSKYYILAFGDFFWSEVSKTSVWFFCQQARSQDSLLWQWQYFMAIQELFRLSSLLFSEIHVNPESRKPQQGAFWKPRIFRGRCAFQPSRINKSYVLLGRRLKQTEICFVVLRNKCSKYIYLLYSHVNHFCSAKCQKKPKNPKTPNARSFNTKRSGPAAGIQGTRASPSGRQSTSIFFKKTNQQWLF